jgi:hypothetical protein
MQPLLCQRAAAPHAAQVFILDRLAPGEAVVPCGLDLLLAAAATGASSQHGELAVAVLPRQGPPATRTHTSDYSAVSQATGQCLVSIRGMQARSMPAAAPAAAGEGAHAAAPAQDVVYRVEWQADATQPGPGAAAVSDAVLPVISLEPSCGDGAACANAAALLQTWLQQPGSGSLPLQLQAAGEQHVAPHPAPVAAAAAAAAATSLAAGMAGMLRTIAQELPGQQLSVRTSDPAGQPAAAAAVRLTATPAGEADVFGSHRAAALLYAPRLVQSAEHNSQLGGDFQLVPRPRGSLDALLPQSTSFAKPAAGQLLVAVRAVGLNFRWVAPGQRQGSAGCA